MPAQTLAKAEIGVPSRGGRAGPARDEGAAEWFEKAARKGSADAMVNLGLLYAKGQGVPQSYERAVELYKQSAAQGNAVSQRDQAHFLLQIFKQPSLVFTHHPPLHISN